jgi:hypothetical protein
MLGPKLLSWGDPGHRPEPEDTFAEAYQTIGKEAPIPANAVELRISDGLPASILGWL